MDTKDAIDFLRDLERFWIDRRATAHEALCIIRRLKRLSGVGEDNQNGVEYGQTIGDVLRFGSRFGYPIRIRPAFTLPDVNPTIVRMPDDARPIVGNLLELSPTGQVEMAKAD